MWPLNRKKKTELTPPQAAPKVNDDPLLSLGSDVRTSIEDGTRPNLRNAAEDSADAYDAKMAKKAMDSKANKAMDDSTGAGTIKSAGYPGVPAAMQNWYMGNGFIGWQSCAILAQHWLIEKACSMPGKDAVRNGYEVQVNGKETLTKEQINKITAFDRKFRVLANCAELVKFTNVFGIRVVMFKVESDDPGYYEKPFNIDGVRAGSYRGMAQIDPYWMAPLLDNAASADPSSIHFYEPTWWVINGKKVHRSHLHISTGASVADILKPSYYYGGIPLVQRIYERVYAAERTANESPLLAMSKRTNVLKVDMKAATAKFSEVAKRLMDWITFRDNHGIRVIDKNEELLLQDTSLAELDSVITGQYQLVAAIAEVPSTKLLGTSPKSATKGFAGSGDYEELSYHEKLETIQAEQMNGLVERHHLLLCKSLNIDVQLQVVWNPVGTKSPEQLAELNFRKAEAGKYYIENGVISPDEERERLRADKFSGYFLLTEEQAETEIGVVEKKPDPETQSNVGDEGDGVVEGQPEPTSAAPTSRLDYLSRGAAEQRGGPTVQRPYKVKRTVEPSTVGIIKEQGGSGQPQSGVTVESLLEEIGCLRAMLEAGSVANAMDADEGTYSHDWHGLPIFIETRKGEVREGIDMNGEPFSNVMPVDYGYIHGFTAADGDSVDCFIGPDSGAGMVYVVNQINPETGLFDEHKVMLDFSDIGAAERCYDAAYSTDWKGKESIASMTVDAFKDWLVNGDQKAPIDDGDY